MASMGVPEEEIPKFQDATYWIKYFPELGLVRPPLHRCYSPLACLCAGI